MRINKVTEIFRNDLRRIIRNPIAMIILIGISILPSLYAWVNIKACWNVYDNTKNIPIAVVNNDEDVYLKDQKINVGNQIVEQLKHNDKIKWVFTTASDADLGIMDSTYYAVIEIPSNFSAKLMTLISDNPQKPEITYKVDTKANPVANKITSSANSTLIQQVTTEFIDTVNETAYGYINQAGQTADQNVENILKLKDSVVLLNRNMDTITDSLKNIETNSNNLNGLLQSISASMPYVKSSLNSVGAMNDDNQKILGNMQNSMDNASKSIALDLSYAKNSNNKITALFSTLNDSASSANSQKINTVIPIINQQLSSMNSSIDATIKYLGQCRDYDYNSDINAAISALNTLKNSLIQLEKTLKQLQTDINTLQADTVKLSEALQKDSVAIKEAIKNADSSLDSVISELTAINSIYKSESLEKLISELQAIKDQHIGDTLITMLGELQTSLVTVSQELTSLSASITSVITQVDAAINTVNNVIGSLQQFENTNSTTRKQQLTNMISDLQAIKPYISDEQNQLTNVSSQLLSANTTAKNIMDQVNADCNTIANQLDSALQLYSSGVDTDIKIIGSSLSVSLQGTGDLINMAKDLSDQIEDMVKLAQSGTDMSSGFSNDLFIKLQQFKGVISSLGGKLEDINNNDITKIIGIMQNDPKLMGGYFSDPFEINEETIYAIPNYGTGMAPIYTTLALWVGCLVLNAILKTEVAPYKGAGNLSVREKHFGKMILFCSLAVIQGLVVSLGDIFIMKIHVVSPGLFIFFCVFSSIVFSIITFTLLSQFGNVGKALGIVYLILQVAGSGGSYPIQVDPPIFSVLRYFFPFTYTLGGLREAIAGPLSGSVTGDVVGLIIFGALFLVVGYYTVTSARKTTHKFELGFKNSGLGE